MLIIEGKMYKFGDNIDTDQIYPGRYLELSNHEEIARHAMEGIDPDFVNKIEDGDIIVAGENFGCGSSREHAVICLQEAGVGGIIAKSFARIFFRNAINRGLTLVEFSDVEKLSEGEIVKIDIERGVIEDKSGQEYRFTPFPENILNIIKTGGIIKYYLQRRKAGD